MRQGRFLTGSLRRGAPLPYGRGSETPGGGAFQQAAQSVMHPTPGTAEVADEVRTVSGLTSLGVWCGLAAAAPVSRAFAGGSLHGGSANVAYHQVDADRLVGGKDRGNLLPLPPIMRGYLRQ